MHFLKNHRLIIPLSLAGLLFCTPAFAQDPLPTSPTPVPANIGVSDNSAKSGKSPANLPKKSIDSHQRAGLLLSGYHGIPPKSVFDDNLAQPQKVLLSFARNEKILPLQRQRALEALGYFADAQVEALYRDLLQDKQTAEMTRHRVMGLLATNFPQTALPALEPFLEHSDLQYRLSAIDAVRRIPGDAAHLALQKAAKFETNKVAQKRLTKYTRITR